MLAEPYGAYNAAIKWLACLLLAVEAKKCTFEPHARIFAHDPSIEKIKAVAAAEQ